MRPSLSKQMIQLSRGTKKDVSTSEFFFFPSRFCFWGAAFSFFFFLHLFAFFLLIFFIEESATRIVQVQPT